MIPIVRKGIYCEQSNKFGYSIENAVNRLSINLMETEKCELARCEILKCPSSIIFWLVETHLYYKFLKLNLSHSFELL